MPLRTRCFVTALSLLVATLTLVEPTAAPAQDEQVEAIVRARIAVDEAELRLERAQKLFEAGVQAQSEVTAAEAALHHARLTLAVLERDATKAGESTSAMTDVAEQHVDRLEALRDNGVVASAEVDEAVIRLAQCKVRTLLMDIVALRAGMLERARKLHAAGAVSQAALEECERDLEAAWEEVARTLD